MKFTDEQKEFLTHARDGKDVLVDACIGSGKTTAIQAACEVLRYNKILYLTYNRRLLEEARRRIDGKNASVHTFHSFAGTMLNQADLPAGSEREVIPQFVRHMKRVYRYDTVIVDEYQDLSEDLKDMLWHICRMSYDNYGFCPQLLIVGDKDQKISDHTTIDAVAEVHRLMDFLDVVHGDKHIEMQFTNCFRLGPEYAQEIGQAWGKSIIGLNSKCTIHDMGVREVALFLSKFEPEDILVLGNNMSWGARVEIQNTLEREWPEKFNKHTVYSAISEYDSDRRGLDASKCAIFTTFDSAKGLERKVCVVCNFDGGYLKARMEHQTSRQVLKNLFLVAASRGKEYNIFCYRKSKQDRLTFDEIKGISGAVPIDMRPAYMNDLYDYKIKEDVDACIDCLEIEIAKEPEGDISVPTKSGQIDISMCQGLYAQAVYFKGFDIESMITIAWNERIAKGNFPRLPAYDKSWPLWRKILYLVALNTGQERYATQIVGKFIEADDERKLIARLSSMFDEYASVERTCTVMYKSCEASARLKRPDGSDKYVMGDKLLRGRADLIVDDIPWELKFAADLKSEHALQAALYAVALDREYAMLYNMRNGEAWKISIPDRAEFLNRTLACVSKHKLRSKLAVIAANTIDLKGA